MADIRDEIARLAEAPAHDLRIEWRRHYRAEPPARLSRDLLLRGVAFKLQERAHGGLSQVAKRTLRRLAEKLEIEGDGCLDAVSSLTPGARLVRQWRGQSYAVTVLEDGFDYEGQRYRSLSRIAQLITGVHWSGPRFFGLTKERQGKPRSPTRTARAEADDGQG
jgi:hypothetical protein